MKYVLLSGGFGIDLSWITDFIIEAIATWFSDLVASALDLFSIGMTSILSLDLTILEQMFTFMVDGYLVIRGFAMILMWTIAIFQLIRAMLGPLTEAEEPLKLIIRTALFAFFVYAAKDITLYAVNLAKIPYAALQNVAGGTGPISFSSTQTTLLGAVGGTIDKLFAMIITVVLIVIIAWNYFKLCLEAVERYALLGIMVYTSPLAFSMGPAQSTKNVFSAWIKMVGSQIVLMMSNVFFLRGFAYAYSLDIGSFNQILANLGMQQSNVGAATLWCFLLIAWLKIGQRFDSYLNSLGLSVAQTGGNMGAELLATAHMVKAAYNSAKEGVKMLSSSLSDRKNAAGGATNPAASHHTSSPAQIGASQQNSAQNLSGPGQRQAGDNNATKSSAMGKAETSSGINTGKNSAPSPGVVGEGSRDSSGKANAPEAVSADKKGGVSQDEKPVGDPAINTNSAETVFPGLAGNQSANGLNDGVAGDSPDIDNNAQNSIGNYPMENAAVQSTSGAIGADVQSTDGSDSALSGNEMPNFANDNSIEAGADAAVPVGENIPHTGMPESSAENNGAVSGGSDTGETVDGGSSSFSPYEDGSVPVGMTMNAGVADSNIETGGFSDNPQIGADVGDPTGSGDNVSAIGGDIVNSAGSDMVGAGHEDVSTDHNLISSTGAIGIDGGSTPVGNGVASHVGDGGNAGGGAVPVGSEATSRMGETGTGEVVENMNRYGGFAVAGAAATMNHQDADMNVGGQVNGLNRDTDSKPIGDMSQFRGASIQATRQDGVSQMTLTNGGSSTSYSAEKYEAPSAPHTTIMDRDGNQHYITQPTANYEIFDGLTPVQNMFERSESDAMDLSRAKNPDYSSIAEGKFSFHGGMINGERVKLTAYDTALYSLKGVEGQDYFLRKDQNGSTWAFSKKRLHRYPSPKKRRR